MEDTIGELHKLLKVATQATQADREKRKSIILERRKSTFQDGRSAPYNFSEYFHNITTTVQPESLLPSALRILWRHFPKWKDLESKVGNADDPGDGMLYDDERVAKANGILQDFNEAWLNAELPASHPPPPPNLPEMGKICLILTGMRQQTLLEDFLHSGCKDKDLPLGKARLAGVLRPEHIDHAGTFATEQFRAVSREWKEGQHLEIDDEEPLPLILEKHYDTGSFGKVYRVRDPFSGDLYARKDQITDSDQITADARKHLEEETKRLKGLKHRHIVQVVKTYQRGKAYGILLKPAATSDLQKLLGRNNKDKFYSVKGCRDSVWLRPLLLTAFGCLSHALAFIHSRDIRHKDVKPANILYQEALPNDDKTARFLWADFGLAYDFSKSGNSKTRSTKLYSPRYAAPEIVAANQAAHKGKKAGVPSTLDNIVENGGEMLIKADVANDGLHDHGRASDIFSLGCVFLELLAGLVKEKLPLEKHDPGDDKLMFAHNIPGLLAWSKTCLERHVGCDELKPLLSLAEWMISPKPNDRPLVDAVVAKLKDSVAGHKYFCRACWNDIASPKSSPESPPAASPISSAKIFLLERVNSAGSILVVRPQLTHMFQSQQFEEKRHHQAVHNRSRRKYSTTTL